MKWVVLATDGISEAGLAPIAEDDRFELRVIDESGSTDFAESLGDAAALLVRSATRVDAAMLDSAPGLRAIGRAGVGVDNVDLAAASSRGVAVFNAPGGNTIAAAELTLALMLAVARRVVAADLSIRSGRWDRSALRGVELRGRTLGLIGAGRIGAEVARRCQAFGMEVVAHDPYLTDDQTSELGVPIVGLDELLEDADIVSLHVPLNAETRGLIDHRALERMKDSAFVINVSRGGVIVEEDLASALVTGRISGAGLDVYETEPLPEDSPLRHAPNLVLTPHLGASTSEAQVSVAREVALAVKMSLVDDDSSSALNAADLT